MIGLNYDICMAIGQDAGDRNMRAHERTVWDSADYNTAAAATNALLRKLAIQEKREQDEKIHNCCKTGS